jgi:hypothetical protein
MYVLAGVGGEYGGASAGTGLASAQDVLRLEQKVDRLAQVRHADG